MRCSIRAKLDAAAVAVCMLKRLQVARCKILFAKTIIVVYIRAALKRRRDGGWPRCRQLAAAAVKRCAKADDARSLCDSQRTRSLPTPLQVENALPCSTNRAIAAVFGPLKRLNAGVELQRKARDPKCSLTAPLFTAYTQSKQRAHSSKFWLITEPKRTS